MKKSILIILLVIILGSICCRTVPQTVFYDIENKTVLIKEDTNITIVHMEEGTTLNIKNGALVQKIQ